MISSDDETLDIAGAIRRLRQEGTDDAFYEAKACDMRLSADVWESVSAFANTSGGVLLLGLDERNDFQLAKHFDIDKVRDQFIEGIGDGGVSGARLGNPPRYVMNRADVDGKQILAIVIKENEIGEKPCYIKAKGIESGSYKRIDDKDVRLSAMEIYEYRNALVPSKADNTIVPESDIDDLDPQLVNALIERRRQSKALLGASTREEQLERLNVIDKQGAVKLAGLLVVGKYPQQFEPKLLIDVAAHPGTEKSEPGMPRFLDRVLCDGSLPGAIDDALHAVVKNLRTISHVQGVGRVDECEIPEAAIREAIANAVIHREYHPYFTGQSVSVDIFRDRMVVTNPGGLWGGKTLENIADGSSRCRNVILMQLMEEVPVSSSIGSTVEGQGSGIAMMVRLMRDRGLPEPEFKATADQFTVVFHRPDVADIVARPASGKDADGKQKREEPTKRMAEFLTLLGDDSEKSARELAEEANVSIETARRALNDLLRAGKIKATAPLNSRNRRYRAV